MRNQFGKTKCDHCGRKFGYAKDAYFHFRRVEKRSLMMDCRNDQELIDRGYKVISGIWTKYATEKQIAAFLGSSGN